ncbi:MAG: omptin family outer membrane protease [Candidatus Omnitrophica bacterium]|nr:omptin family outer membrane protease [Candidatus Omnitrophota bacterium]
MRIKGAAVCVFCLLMMSGKAGAYTEVERQEVMQQTLDEVEISVDVRAGYLRGETAYDFNHQTSELTFPLDNWVMGTGVRVSWAPFSFNGVFYAPVEHDAGDMKDRDWNAGGLISETYSDAAVDAIILDGNLRYDFYRRTLADSYDDFALRADDEVRVGALLGYRYERYDYDMYEVYYQRDLIFGRTGQTLYSDTLVLTYKVEYFLPYLGLAGDVKRDNWGVGAEVKYSFYPTAYDVDNHLLRGLTFYGDYEGTGNVWMGSIHGFWDFCRAWRVKGGVDLMVARISGTTYEEQRDPAWNADQAVDMRHWLVWGAIEYTF